jgi:hypothetical protein
MKKVVDMTFSPVAVLRLRPEDGRIFLGEILMLRRSLHTNQTPFGAAAFRDTRIGTGLCVLDLLCAETMNYQPKPSGLDRSQQLI